MRYEIKGTPFPVVICQLENGEQMVTERGSMVWMSPNMEMQTHGGGLGRMFSKMFSGESMFQNIYTAHGAGMIAFGSSFPGQIKEIAITPGHDMILQKSAFLAAVPGVELSIHFNQRLGAGLFGGEGFIMQRLSGSGMAFAEIDGTLVEYDLQPGQQIVVDTGNVAGFTAGVQMEIRQVPGMKNKLLGGEPFQHRPHRSRTYLAADHAHLRRGRRPAALYPHRQQLSCLSGPQSPSLRAWQFFYFSRNKTASPRITGMTGDKSL